MGGSRPPHVCAYRNAAGSAKKNFLNHSSVSLCWLYFFCFLKQQQQHNSVKGSAGNILSLEE